MNIDRDTAYVYHYPLTRRLKGEPVEWALIPVDLEPGRNLAAMLTALRYDRTHKDAFGQPIAAPTPPPVVEQPATGDDARQMPSPVATPTLVEFFDDINTSPLGGKLITVDVEAITATIRAHRDGPTPTLDELRATAIELTKHDPEFDPRLRAYFDRNGTDTNDAAQVAEAIDAVRNFHDVTTVPVARTNETVVPQPIPRVVDEGPEVDADTVAAAGKRYAGLDDAARSWVSLCAAKVRLSPEHGGVASTRRMELLRGLCELGESDGFDTDDMVRAIAALVGLGDAAWQTRRIADVVAALTLEEAVAFAKVADVVTTGDVAIRWESDGRCVLSASVLGEVAA